MIDVVPSSLVDNLGLRLNFNHDASPEPQACNASQNAVL